MIKILNKVCFLVFERTCFRWNRFTTGKLFQSCLNCPLFNDYSSGSDFFFFFFFFLHFFIKKKKNTNTKLYRNQLKDMYLPIIYMYMHSCRLMFLRLTVSIGRIQWMLCLQNCTLVKQLLPYPKEAATSHTSVPALGSFLGGTLPLFADFLPASGGRNSALEFTGNGQSTDESLKINRTRPYWNIFLAKMGRSDNPKTCRTSFTLWF